MTCCGKALPFSVSEAQNRHHKFGVAVSDRVRFPAHQQRLNIRTSSLQRNRLWSPRTVYSLPVYSKLFCFALFCSILLYSTLLHYIILCSVLLNYILLYSVKLYFSVSLCKWENNIKMSFQEIILESMD
jgi:hypothetical protein